MSIVLVGATSGSCTLQEQAVAGTTVLTLPTTSGTVLTSASTGISASNITTGTLPKAQLPTGSVLQVVQGTPKTDTFSTTSTSMVDITGLSATITPTSASNRILVIVDLHIGYSIYAGVVHLLRGSTKIYAGDGGLNRCGLFSNVYGSSNTNTLIPVTAMCLDSPGTTSATTYKLQTTTYGAGTQFVNRTSDDINESNRDGRTVSTITLMEIAV